MMNCQQFKHETVDNTGINPANRVLQAHAAACPACADWRAGQNGVRRLVAELERVNAPADFDFRLRARLAARAAPRAWGWPVPLRLAAGTALAGVMALGIWFGTTRETEHQAGARAESFARAGTMLPLPDDAQIVRPETTVQPTPRLFPALLPAAAQTPAGRAGDISVPAARREVAVSPRRSAETAGAPQSLPVRSVRADVPLSAGANVSIEIPRATSQVKVFLANPQGNRRTLTTGVLIVGRQGLPETNPALPATVPASRIVW